MTTPAPSVPYKLGLNHVGYTTLVICIFFMTLSTLASALRVWTRVVKRAKFGIGYKPSASLLSLAQVSLWSVINLGVAILCACLPTYKLLFGKFHTIGTSLWANHFSANSDSSTTKAAIDAHPSPSAYYYRMGDSNGDNIHMTGVSTQIQSGNEAQSLPSDGVRVQRDVHVS
ncbi:hypothetical protein EAE96_001372 [Botrytis aclada]|nr:hypothetical protein EAE96_001372 [Botrytis aclada]